MEGYSLTRTIYTEKFQEECSNNVIIGAPAPVIAANSAVKK
jgi:hypothetical protein